MFKIDFESSPDCRQGSVGGILKLILSPAPIAAKALLVA